MSQVWHRTTPPLFPYFQYRDALAALKWLSDAFGFEEHLVVPGPDGSVAHAEMRVGSGMIALGSAKDGPLGIKSPRDVGGVTGGVYVYVDNVDEHFARAKAAGAEIVADPRDMEYGAREYVARDPEGHLWSFGTYEAGAP